MPDPAIAVNRLHALPDTGYWSTRIRAELRYAHELLRTGAVADGGPIAEAAEALLAAHRQDGAITRQAVEAAEATLAPLAEAAKRYHILCVGHAHIDMNWMWSWQETVSITIESFRTMLDLLGEYETFTFAQSQASCYQIIERYAPELLDPIRAHVHAGRWELSASHWVEADKNMPTGESFVRHMLYTKDFLGALFDIDPATLNIDFEPDTFGHSAHIPELLQKGGVDYYYHCRGEQQQVIYRWLAPSGASVLTYREPLWYNAELTPSWATVVPEYCKRHGIDTMLKVYGVGDHGGGPTRRDLHFLLDMQRWPIFPRLRFGTYREWFELLASSGNTWPDISGERNFIFTGCYTSQSRIKRGNRLGEEALYRAEWVSSLASLLAGTPYPRRLFTEGWRNVLFNQFHDIIPGSGIIETREYASALYQETQGICTARQSQALNALAAEIDTSAWASEAQTMPDGLPGIAHGAGVGFGVKAGAPSQTGRGDGATRVFVVFNATFAERTEPVELVIWDWQGETSRLRARDADGTIRRTQLLDTGTHHYWGHRFVRLLVDLPLPASGYATVAIDEDLTRVEPVLPDDPLGWRTEKPRDFVLENEHLTARFRSRDLALVSLIDTRHGYDLVDGHREHSGGLRFILEDDSQGMTSWKVGRYMAIAAACRNLQVTAVNLGSELLEQQIAFSASLGERSRIKGRILLRKGQSHLDYELEVDWHEVGRKGEGIPHLQFYLPAAYGCATYAYDVPAGIVRRDGCRMDMPATSCIIAEPADDDAPGLRLITDSKHGFRGADDSLGVTLIRSSYDPDPYPEYGVHTIRVGVGIASQRDNLSLATFSETWRHTPMAIACPAGPGPLPPRQSLATVVDGAARVMAVKLPEDDAERTLIIRLAEYQGQAGEVTIEAPLPIAEAIPVDLHEQPLAGDVSLAGKRATLHLPAHAIIGLRLRLEG